MKDYSKKMYKKSMEIISRFSLLMAMTSIAQCSTMTWHQPPISNELKAKLKDMK